MPKTENNHKVQPSVLLSTLKRVWRHCWTFERIRLLITSHQRDEAAPKLQITTFQGQHTTHSFQLLTYLPWIPEWQTNSSSKHGNRWKRGSVVESFLSGNSWSEVLVQNEFVNMRTWISKKRPLTCLWRKPVCSQTFTTNFSQNIAICRKLPWKVSRDGLRSGIVDKNTWKS